jgi:aspartate 1-decarboxylase
VAVGDIVIIISYAYMSREEAIKYKPLAVFPDEKNQIPDTTMHERKLNEKSVETTKEGMALFV